jgi:D-alanine-D-alanine ligase
VAVLMGGRSSEHPISLASARSVIAALDPERYDVVAVEIARDGRWSVASLSSGHVPKGLAESSPVPDSSAQVPVLGTGGEVTSTLAEVEVVLPILHGPFGEDGALQGVLIGVSPVAYWIVAILAALLGLTLFLATLNRLQ